MSFCYRDIQVIFKICKLANRIWIFIWISQPVCIRNVWFFAAWFFYRCSTKCTEYFCYHGNVLIQTSRYQSNCSEIKLTIDFRSNFVNWIFIIRELQFWNKKGVPIIIGALRQWKCHPIPYSKMAAILVVFVHLQISPCCLVLKLEIQKNIFS